jgi:hypothetical protein
MKRAVQQRTAGFGATASEPIAPKPPVRANTSEAPTNDHAVALLVFPTVPAGLSQILQDMHWGFHEARKCRDVALFLCNQRVPVIITSDGSLGDGNWRDILGYVAPLPCPPRLIVIAEAFDDHLWAEVLHLGGYDVLAQPVRREEVARTLDSAWRRWIEESGSNQARLAGTG